MTTLHDVQEAFANSLIHGLSDKLTPYTVDDPLRAACRFNVYRNNIYIGQSQALISNFPVLKRLIGSPCFAEVAVAFLTQIGSFSGNLNELGESFPDFIATHPLTTRLTYLKDVGRLEWLYLQSYLARQSSHNILDSLNNAKQGDLDSLRFSLSPSAKLFRSRFPVLHIWLANQTEDSGENISLDEGEDLLVLTRPGKEIEIIRLNSGAYAWLDAIHSGANMVEALNAAIDRCDDFDLSHWFSLFVQNGVLEHAYRYGEPAQ